MRLRPGARTCIVRPFTVMTSLFPKIYKPMREIGAGTKFEILKPSRGET